MLTLKDCMDVCGLDEQEIEAIAEHEHIPTMQAVELASFLMATPEGRRRIQRMIVDDLVRACEHGNAHRAERLRGTLARYVNSHPDCL